MNKVVEYVGQCRKKGFSDAYIKASLQEAGHQDYVIKRSISVSRKSNFIKKSSRPVLVLLLLVITLFGIVSAFNLFSDDVSNTVGYAIATEQNEVISGDDDKLQRSIQLLNTKNILLKQQVSMIQSLNISNDEKNILILKQTEEINRLFDEIKTNNKNTVDGSIELINSMLKRQSEENNVLE